MGMYVIIKSCGCELLYDWLITSLLQIFIEFCSGGAVDDIIVGKKDLLSSVDS